MKSCFSFCSRAGRSRHRCSCGGHRSVLRVRRETTWRISPASSAGGRESSAASSGREQSRRSSPGRHHGNRSLPARRAASECRLADCAGAWRSLRAGDDNLHAGAGVISQGHQTSIPEPDRDRRIQTSPNELKQFPSRGESAAGLSLPCSCRSSCSANRWPRA